MMRRVLALTRKEVHQLLRDRSNLMLGGVLPIILILIFGYGLSFDVRDAPVAVVMEDASPLAHEAIAGLTLSRYLAPTIVRDMPSAEALLHAREVDAILRVPPDFSRRFADGDAQLQVILHGVDVARARTIDSYLRAAVGQMALREADRAGALRGGAAAGGPVSIEQRMWFNAANTSTWFLVPGLIVLITTLVGAFLTALVMAREWERGTLEALFVTPVRPIEILVAKLLPYFAVAMLGLVLCLLAARGLFHVPIRGSLAVILLASVCYVFVSLAIGLLISAATKNQFLASQIALVVSFMPALMLSGFLFDLRNMPAAVSALGHVLPATHYLELLKSLFLAGNVWPMILRDTAILLLYALLLLALARSRTRKRLE